MTAPDNIFASPDIDDGWRWIRASQFPEQGPYENVAYTRTATIPDPLDDPRVVALVRAMKAANDYLDRGLPASAFNITRHALSTLTKEPPHER